MWFRLGDWEIAKELLDAINVVGSDSVNDLQQFVNSLLVAVNVELDDTHKKDIQGKQNCIHRLVAKNYPLS